MMQKKSFCFVLKMTVLHMCLVFQYISDKIRYAAM